MSLLILNAVEPTVIPAKIYDRIWIEEIAIRAPDPNGDAIGEVKLRKYGVFDGVAELEPGNGQWIRVENMLAKSSEDNDLAIVMSALLTYIGKIGVENNVVAPLA